MDLTKTSILARLTFASLFTPSVALAQGYGSMLAAGLIGNIVLAIVPVHIILVLIFSYKKKFSNKIYLTITTVIGVLSLLLWLGLFLIATSNKPIVHIVLWSGLGLTLFLIGWPFWQYSRSKEPS